MLGRVPNPITSRPGAAARVRRLLRAVPNLADTDESSDEENEINPRDTVTYTDERWVWRDTSPPGMGKRVALEKDEHGNGNSCQEEN
jgi:hypothetical protein